MNMIILGVVVVVVLVIAVALVLVGMRQSDDEDPLADRLAEYGGTAEISANLEEIEMSVPFTDRVIMPIARGLASFTVQFTPQEALEKTARRLELAGDPPHLTPAIFWVLRFVAMFGLGMVILVVMTISGKAAVMLILSTLGAALIGFFLPAMWLHSKIERRQEEVVKSLPDALDLMSICVNAGLGFDQAMSKVYEKWDNELAISFGRVIQEIQLGKTRREALRAMDDSLGVADVTTFVGAIIQADQLGVSISKILNIQADQMRIKRRQRAQEKAQQAPVKMMFPLVFFIFPSIWIVLLGPAAVQLYRTFFT
jgi:tight adherence protein C